MKINPYFAANEVAFGSAQSTVITRFGQPLCVGNSYLGDIEFEYRNATFRFCPESQELIEVTADSPILFLENLAVRYEVLLEFLRENDEGLFERIGFFVSPKYGIAFDPDHPSYVSAFPKSELAWWQDKPNK